MSFLKKVRRKNAIAAIAERAGCVRKSKRKSPEVSIEASGDFFLFLN